MNLVSLHRQIEKQASIGGGEVREVRRVSSGGVLGGAASICLERLQGQRQSIHFSRDASGIEKNKNGAGFLRRL